MPVGQKINRGNLESKERKQYIFQEGRVNYPFLLWADETILEGVCGLLLLLCDFIFFLSLSDMWSLKSMPCLK